MTIIEPSDSAQRLAALDPWSSFIVSAPAGSGKTGLITQRLLKLLAGVENPEEILCITFTRKAAAEMTQRIQMALREADTQPCPSDAYGAQTWHLATAVLARSASLNWHILDLPGRLRIQTIDGFCRYIASQFALETTLGQLPEPSEEPEICYRSAARTLLDRLEEESPTGDYLAALLAHMGNNYARCEQLLCDLLGKREQWLPLIFNAADNQSYFQQVTDRLITDNLSRLTAELKPIASELIALADGAASRVGADKNPQLTRLVGIESLPQENFDGLLNWRILIDLLMTKKHQWRKTITVREGFPSTHSAEKQRMQTILGWCREQADLNSLMVLVRHLPDRPIDRSQQNILDALAHLLPRLAAELNTLFQAQNQCDYPAITLAAMEALSQGECGQVSDITLRLDYRLRHILVDEFQDTSAAQIELLSSLLSGWQSGDGRSLFLVGDAMQSLYSFRNAKVGLFLRTQRQPLGTVECRNLSLTTNFRSQKPIIDWINKYFSVAFPAQPNIVRGAVPYSQSVACKNHDPDSGVDFIGYCGDAYEQFEAQRIAEICTDIRDNQAPQSVAILVRSRGHLRAIIPALKSAGLEWQATDIDPLATRMAVVDLISLTRALVSPTDRIAWLAVLRAPFCGLDLADLLQISDSGANSSSGQTIIVEQLMQRFDEPDKPFIGALSEHGRMVLARIVPVLKKAWTQRSRTDLRVAVEQCWVGLGGYATLKSPSEQRDVERFLDLLSTHQVAGHVPDWDALQLAVEKLFASPSVANNRLDGLSGIQIMTIHKAKGLEFDQVLLPGLSRATPANDKPLLRWQELIDDSGSSELLMAARGAYDDDDDAHYQYLKYEQTESIHLENTRIIYVAATRAISRLHLFAKLNRSGRAWSAPASGCLLAPIWKSLEADIEAQRFSVTVVENETTTESATAAEAVPQRRLPSNFSAHQPADGGIDNRPATAAIERPNQSATTEPFDSSSLRVRQLGNTLHRALKQVAVEGVEAWPKSRLHGLAKGWRGQLREVGVLASDSELQELLRAVTNTLEDPTGLWLLNGYADSRAELALDYQFPDESQVQRSIVDLTFITDQTRWIIDYKYSLPEHPDGLEAFTRTMQQRYTAQLQHYSRLLQEIDQYPVRCGLYFPRIPMFMEISCD